MDQNRAPMHARRFDESQAAELVKQERKLLNTREVRWAACPHHSAWLRKYEIVMDDCIALHGTAGIPGPSLQHRRWGLNNNIVFFFLFFFKVFISEHAVWNFVQQEHANVGLISTDNKLHLLSLFVSFYNKFNIQPTCPDLSTFLFQSKLKADQLPPADCFYYFIYNHSASAGLKCSQTTYEREYFR